MQLRSSVIHALGALCVAAGAGRASLAQQTRPDAPVAILRLSIPSAAVGSDLYYGFFAHVEEGLYREFAHDPDVQVFPAAAGGGRTSDSPAGDDPIAIDATVTTNGRSTQSSAKQAMMASRSCALNASHKASSLRRTSRIVPSPSGMISVPRARRTDRDPSAAASRHDVPASRPQ